MHIENKNHRLILWLALMCIGVISMIAIGGFTRLTNSGLSITQWDLISGIFPPLTDAGWISEFVKYQKSPEYIYINNQMTIQEFKFIYLTEFFHRLAGRVVGILYIIPMIFFMSSGVIKKKERKIYFVILILIFAQGFMGWYMVKSGLILNPYVSHFRLAAHFMIAILIYALLFWQFLTNIYCHKIIDKIENSKLSSLGLFCIILLMIQMVFGAFVAGLKAGLVYNDFPLMGDSIIPYEIYSHNFDLQFLKSFITDPVFVQFTHRIIAYLAFVFITIYCFHGIRYGNIPIAKILMATFSLLIIQISLGVLTLITNVSLLFALFHQIVAVMLFSFLYWSYFMLIRTKL